MLGRLFGIALFLLVGRAVLHKPHCDDGQGPSGDSGKDTGDSGKGTGKSGDKGGKRGGGIGGILRKKKGAPGAASASAAAAPPAAKTSRSTAGSDLTVIEGIGPKIKEILGDGGIQTVEDLAKASVEDLRTILTNAGSRYRQHDPTTWPQQADLAARGKTDELAALQQELKGGRKV